MHILIADDHVLFRQALIMVTETVFPSCSITQCGNWKDVRQLCLRDNFDLALFDIFMLSKHSWEHELKIIIKQYPNLLICMISSSSEQIHIETAFKLGAKGYLCKTAIIEEVKQALLTVSQGELYIPLQSWQYVGNTLGLTHRQQEILKLMAQGKSAKVIARELQVSDNTVKSHIATIYRVLNVTNRIEAINIARQRGLLGYY
jgi:DNA-binding NarL/FixJ family response regulator